MTLILQYIQLGRINLMLYTNMSITCDIDYRTLPWKRGLKNTDSILRCSQLRCDTFCELCGLPVLCGRKTTR